jgi:hypothetical protein
MPSNLGERFVALLPLIGAVVLLILVLRDTPLPLSWKRFIASKRRIALLIGSVLLWAVAVILIVQAWTR